MSRVFIAGATGFLGSQLACALVARGHSVTALTRQHSVHKLPPGVCPIIGDPLQPESFASAASECETYVHLIGVHKPAPWKGAAFRAVDLLTLEAAVAIAARAPRPHFVYVSVAQPAPIMRSYIEVRQQCEAAIRDAGLTATILRPWYVMGPGRRWPLLLKPAYWAGERMGADWTRRLGLLTQQQMLGAMTWAIENPGSRVLEVDAIRQFGTG